MPASSVAWMSMEPFLALSATPLTSMLTVSSAMTLTREIRLRSNESCRLRSCGIHDAAPAVVDHVLELVAEFFQEALHRPRRRVTQAADGMPLDAVGHLDDQIELGA